MQIAEQELQAYVVLCLYLPRCYSTRAHNSEPQDICPNIPCVKAALLTDDIAGSAIELH